MVNAEEFHKWVESARKKFTAMKHKNEMLMQYVKYLEGYVRNGGDTLESVRGKFIESFNARAVELKLPVVHTIRFDASNGMFDKTFVCATEEDYQWELNEVLEDNRRSGNRITTFKEIV